MKYINLYQAKKIKVISTNNKYLKFGYDGENGIVLKDRNPETMADAIISLLTDKDKAKTFGLNGKAKVERLYNWDKNVDYMLSIYKQLSDIKE